MIFSEDRPRFRRFLAEHPNVCVMCSPRFWMFGADVRCRWHLTYPQREFGGKDHLDHLTYHDLQCLTPHCVSWFQARSFTDFYPRSRDTLQRLSALGPACCMKSIRTSSEPISEMDFWFQTRSWLQSNSSPALSEGAWQHPFLTH